MLPLIFGAFALAGAAVMLWWTVASGRTGTNAAARNLAAGLPVVTDLRQVVLAHSATDRAVQPTVAFLARKVRRLTPSGRLAQLERRIVAAGSPRGWWLERVLAAKATLGMAGAGLGGLWFLGGPTLTTFLLLVGLAALGFWLPDLLLSNRAIKRRDAIRLRLPDTLDQLTITVEAGLGFDAAMARSAATTTGPLAEELGRTLQDVRAGMTRREALRGLVDRIDLPELRSFVTAVLQAEQYGVPVAQVLRVQARELRVKRRQRAEEQAAKLPVKLLFPTVLFIFPVLFIVLLGPAAIQISHTLLKG
jgi:tight adherence protein C